MPPQPQAPNPGPAPFQQANQGLTAARQGGGGPSPVASLVAATQRPAPRTQHGRPGRAPQADFSGISQAGSAIGNALRVKYQREFDKETAKQAHEDRKEATAERIKLEEESSSRSRIRIAAMEATNAHLGHRLTKASRNVEGLARARTSRLGSKAPLKDDWAEYNYLIEASDELFMDTATAYMWEDYNAQEETPVIYQDWLNQMHDDAGMSRPPQIEALERRHDTEDVGSPFQGELRETDLIHGEGGRGFSPAQRVGGNMMVVMGNHALISHQLSELENILDINAQLKVLDDTSARVVKQNIFNNTREGSIYSGFFGQDMVSETTKDGVTSYGYKHMEHRPVLREEVRDLVRSNLERDTLTSLGPYQNLTDDEVGDMIKGIFTGELGGIVGEYLDMPDDEQVLARAATSLLPGGDKTGMPAFNPRLAHVVHSVLANLDEVMLAIVPTAPGKEDGKGGVVASTKEIKSQLASFYGFVKIDDDEVPLMLDMHNQIRARIKRGLRATGAQGAFDYALSKQAAAVRMDADIHIKELVNQGIEPLEAVIEHYNENMPPYIDMNQEDFERTAIQLFGALGSPGPLPVAAPPADQSAQQPSAQEPPFAGQPVQQPAPQAPPQQPAPPPVPQAPPQPPLPLGRAIRP